MPEEVQASSHQEEEEKDKERGSSDEQIMHAFLFSVLVDSIASAITQFSLPGGEGLVECLSIVVLLKSFEISIARTVSTNRVWHSFSIGLTQKGCLRFQVYSYIGMDVAANLTSVIFSLVGPYREAHLVGKR